MLPGFGGSDSMDWRAFVEALLAKGFGGPFEIENEAQLSKATGNEAAVDQGHRAAILFLAPMLWPLTGEGYRYDTDRRPPLSAGAAKDLPVVSMKELL
jgi:hypothetical protein